MPLFGEDVFSSSAGALKNEFAHVYVLPRGGRFEQALISLSCPQIQAFRALWPGLCGRHIRTHIVHPLDSSVKGLKCPFESIFQERL